MRGKRKKAIELEYDSATEQIKQLLIKIPGIGKFLALIYIWKPMLFNFMIVGASGTVLSWLLYEWLFRVLLVGFWGGTFLAMVLTTFLVFLWNYTWNKKWSLKPELQIMKMKKHELEQLKEKIDRLLHSWFDYKGAQA